MTLGSRVDDLIGDAIVAAGRLADKALTRLSGSDFNERAAQRFLTGAQALTEAEAEEDVYEPVGEYPDLTLISAPGTAAPVDGETPRVGIPPDAGPGLPTSDLLIAAANQLEVWLGTHWFRRLDERDTRELSTFRAAYLDELIPELRDRAAQFSAISD